MQYHALNEHISSTCTGKSCIQTLVKIFFSVQKQNNNKNLKAKKKARKKPLKKKNNIGVISFLRRKKTKNVIYTYISASAHGRETVI